MASFLDELGDNQAVLLMYLADELSAAERAQVERKLADDPALRAELERLCELHHAVTHAFETRPQASPAADDAAVKRVVREMRRYQLELLARPSESLAQRRAWPKWVYPVGAAAAMVFLLIGLWGVGAFDLGPQPGSSTSALAVAQDDPAEAVAILLEEKWLSDSVEWALDQAAEHATELQNPDEEDPLLLMTM